VAEAAALEVLLIRRGGEPFRGSWALPGGFVELEEDLPEAAARELLEETGVRALCLEQAGTWGKPGRDPRWRTVTVVYVGVVRPGPMQVQGADDASDARWHPAQALPHLAFDHDQVVPATLDHLRRLCERTHMAFGLLSEEFSQHDLAQALDALGAGNPSAAAMQLLEAGEVAPVSGKAAAGLYRLTAPDCRLALKRPVLMFPPARG